MAGSLDGSMGALNSQFPPSQQFEAMKRHLIQQQAQQLMNQTSQVQLGGAAGSAASAQISQMLQSQLNSTPVSQSQGHLQQPQQPQQQPQQQQLAPQQTPPGSTAGLMQQSSILGQASTPQPQGPPSQHPPRASSVPSSLGGSQPPTPLGAPVPAPLPPPSQQLPDQILATEDPEESSRGPDPDLSLTLSTPEGSAATTPAQGKKSIENFDSSSGGPKSMKDGSKMEVDCKPDLRSIGKGENRLEGPGENGLPSFGPVKEEPLSVKEEHVSTPASSMGGGDAPTPAAKPDIKPVIAKTEPVSTAAESSSSSSMSASSPPKPRSNKKVFKPDELRQALMPTLEKLYRQDPHSLPFRQPVDPQLLQIPDYFDIVKNPMDLSTIKRKLDTGQYQDPWQYVDDVWLMFDNAWF